MLLLVVNKEKESSVNCHSYLKMRLNDIMLAFFHSLTFPFLNFTEVKNHLKKELPVHNSWSFFYIARHFIFNFHYLNTMKF